MLIILSKDLIKESDSLSVTSEQGAFPISNIKSDRRLRVWKSTTTASQTITSTWNNQVSVNFIAIAFSNFIDTSKIIVRGFTNSGDISPVYDSGLQSVNYSFDIPAGHTSIGISSFSEGGGTYFSFLFPLISVEKVEIELRSFGNPDGNLTVSRLLCGEADSIQNAPDLNSAVMYRDNSEFARSEAGSLLFTFASEYKIVSFSIEQADLDDKKLLADISERCGISSPIFASGYNEDDDKVQKQVYQVYGFIANSVELASPLYNKYSTILDVSEI